MATVFIWGDQMILSVSRRTDIPAFYSEWFFNRVKEGFVCVRNPMNVHQVSRVDISPKVVDCIVFWTKNPAPMLPRLNELEQYKYYFQYTVTDYGKEVEPRVPELERRLETFIALSEAIGRERVIWRYDPILFSDAYTPKAHLESFSRIAQKLRGYTEKCVISLVDVYPSKNAGNLTRLGAYQPNSGILDPFLKNIADIARENGLVTAACAEALPLEKYGIEQNSCIDRALIERITGCRLNVKPDGQRPNCACVKCEDIGSYDTCLHGCVYCYANFRPDIVNAKAKSFDANSPLLCDKLSETDKITVRPVKSFKQMDPSSDEGIQLTLF